MNERKQIQNSFIKQYHLAKKKYIQIKSYFFQFDIQARYPFKEETANTLKYISTNAKLK